MLTTAALAALAGFGAIGTGIGIPLFRWLHGGHPDPMAVVFSVWGSGAPPRRPPRGGEKISQLRLLETRAARPPVETERKAA